MLGIILSDSAITHQSIEFMRILRLFDKRERELKILLCVQLHKQDSIVLRARKTEGKICDHSSAQSAVANG